MSSIWKVEYNGRGTLACPEGHLEMEVSKKKWLFIAENFQKHGTRSYIKGDEKETTIVTENLYEYLIFAPITGEITDKLKEKLKEIAADMCPTDDEDYFEEIPMLVLLDAIQDRNALKNNEKYLEIFEKGEKE